MNTSITLTAIKEVPLGDLRRFVAHTVTLNDLAHSSPVFAVVHVLFPMDVMREQRALMCDRDGVFYFMVSRASEEIKSMKRGSVSLFCDSLLKFTLSRLSLSNTELSNTARPTLTLPTGSSKPMRTPLSLSCQGTSKSQNSFGILLQPTSSLVYLCDAISEYLC